MFSWILKKIVGSKNQRELRRMMPAVKQIDEIEEGLRSSSDDDLRAKTHAWKERLSKISDSDKLAAELDAHPPEAFAVVKNGSPPPLRTRVHGLRISSYLEHDSFRCAAHRRHGPAPRPHRRDGHR
jgi:preprotein translocase subunit SecA